MIEFKAECGHTIRAKDEHAGGVVRCSYCGYKASVPDTRGDDLNFLLRDVEQAADAPEGAQRGKRRWSRLFRRPRRKRAQFDPFAIIVRMCYAAGLLIIVIFVGRKFVIPLFQEGGLLSRISWLSEEEAPAVTEPDPTAPEDVDRRGLLTSAVQTGLYVDCTPPGATVYIAEVSQAPTRGRISGVAEKLQLRSTGRFLDVPDGRYVVEVVLPWHHPNLSNAELPNNEDYLAFRRAVERASDGERIRLLEDYFVPDGAWPVFIDQTADQIYIVRQYRNVQVRKGRLSCVRALFLPKIRPPGGKSFSIASLVAHYIPARRAYAFDEDHVRSELNYYGVPEPDREFAIKALARIGVIPYVTPDGRTRLFKIGIQDGVFATEVIRESTE